MKISDVTSYWLRCPIAADRQHRSDLGHVTHFDMTLVMVTTEDGLTGYGESKGGVGSEGSGASIVACVEHELKPRLLGEDPRNIKRIWERLYSGTRDHYALARGRSFPDLGRRGLTIAAISGVDMALWDLLGKSLGVPVVQLLGGPCRPSMPAYASGGWADAKHIGRELGAYTAKGFQAVKMRVGVMDDQVQRSVERVKAARAALGQEVKLMIDAHGSFSVPEAKQFCQGVEDCDLYWFEEPVSADNVRGMAQVRRSSSIPIAAGESVFTRFDVRDLVDAQAIDVVQPDCAIVGGITESLRIAHLAETWHLELAPHLWGSAMSFMAGLHLAFASTAACILEFSLGANPMLHELVEETIAAPNGRISAPTEPGLGVTPRAAFIEEYRVGT